MTAFEMALGMCKFALSGLLERQQQPLSREQIARQAAEVAGLPTFAGQVDLERLIAQLERDFTVWSNDPRALANDDDHVPWLPRRRGEIDWRFWNRYKLFLIQSEGLKPAAVANVEKVVDEVLGRLEEPARAGPWDRRGLVMGNVQSGKTGAYTGLVCKAADAGYKVFIVLAGLHNNLRSQTQVRLDEGFLGYMAVPPEEARGGFQKVGVAKFGPGLRADSVTNRKESGDFRRTIAQHFAIHPGGNPLLFVVKKNVTILRNLLAWIDHSADSRDPSTGRKYHKDTPLLLIDDESDQASIDTRRIPFDENGNPDEEHDPTRTNALIRSLLYAFDKSAYVGFTATPFANIFIHEKAKTKELGEDLFPRSFILNLPAPSNYVGASRVFGIPEDEEAGIDALEALPITKIVGDYAKVDETEKVIKPTETEGWMPPKLLAKTEHVPLFEGRRAVPPSLRTAVLCFILSSAVRSLREAGPLINSMLVHVVRFTKVQEIVHEEIAEELAAITRRLQFGDGARQPTIREEFRKLWDTDYVPTSAACGIQYVLPNWEEVDAELSKIAASIEVKSINGSALDALNYEEHRQTGLNVIAVGGDKLSRGLTLDGLTVSYFLRASRMYDTLMQMGRWFGYREAYIDTCRLFTTEDLAGWFRHIAMASEELKREFDYMVSIGATPRQYGLRVRSHPVLLVTSEVKMRHGTEMRLSYSGDISETVLFNPAKADANLKVLRRMLEDLGPYARGGRKRGYYWSPAERNADKVLQFLSAYDAADAPRANPPLWVKYIRRQMEQDELKSWSIFLASSGLQTATPLDQQINGLEVGAIERKADSSTDARHTIGRLVNPADELEDLSDDERKTALSRTVMLWEKDTRKNKRTDAPADPSGKGIRYARPKSRALLLIYPLAGPNGVTLTGVAISFPESDTSKEISYVVTGRYAEDADFGDI